MIPAEVSVKPVTKFRGIAKQALGALLVMICVSGSSTSATSPRLGPEPSIGVPTRALTETELLLNGVENSDVIVVATIRSANQEIVERIGTNEHFMLTYSIVDVKDVLLAPQTGRIRGEIPISIGADKIDEFKGMISRGRPVVLFLRALNGSQSAKTKRDGLLTFEFVNIANKYVPGHGALELPEGSATMTKRKVRDAVVLANPENLVSLADLVVRGHHEGSPSVCGGNATRQLCANIVVDKVFYGDAPPGPLHVFSAVPGYVPAEDCIFFLKRTPEKTFEVIGLSSGAKRVSGKHVGRRSKNLETMERELELADATRRERMKAR